MTTPTRRAVRDIECLPSREAEVRQVFAGAIEDGAEVRVVTDIPEPPGFRLVDKPHPLGTLPEWTDRNYRRKVERIAQDLRDLADRIDRERDVSTVSTYVSAAGTITQAILNELPVLGLQALAQYAYEADVARKGYET